MQNDGKGEKEFSCDSKFMLGVMDELGNFTWITYRIIGVANEEIIYLVMDNTGGHGAKRIYVRVQWLYGRKL